MKLPEWTKPALIGAVVGAVVLAILGFGWGGWMTGGDAESMARMQTSAAVAEALTPYCVLKSQTDPNRVAVNAELEAASSYQKASIIRESGWATPLGEDAPNTQLAQLCLAALDAS